MASRLNLHEDFCGILASRNAYFQPPASVQINYSIPAIIYSLSEVGKLYANNDMYKSLTAYTVTLIDKNPDTKYLELILRLPYCSFDRFYTADNLNHWVFTLYY